MEHAIRNTIVTCVLLAISMSCLGQGLLYPFVVEYYSDTVSVSLEINGEPIPSESFQLEFRKEDGSLCPFEWVGDGMAYLPFRRDSVWISIRLTYNGKKRIVSTVRSNKIRCLQFIEDNRPFRASEREKLYRTSIRRRFGMVRMLMFCDETIYGYKLKRTRAGIPGKKAGSQPMAE